MARTRLSSASTVTSARGLLFWSALIIGAFLLTFGSRVTHAQAAGDGEPWTMARDYAGDFDPNSCGPTMSATSCANEYVTWVCANAPGSVYCGASISSCTAFGTNGAICALGGPGTGWNVEVTAPTPHYFASRHAYPLADCGSCVKNNNNPVSDPVNPSNGSVSYKHADVSGFGSPLAFKRFYNSQDPNGTDLGIGWRHSYSRQIIPIVLPMQYLQWSGSDPLDSAVYSDPTDACQYGWESLVANSPWPSSWANYSGGVCLIMQGSTAVSTVPIYSSVQIGSLVSGGTTIGYTATRDDGQEINFTLSGSTIVPPTGTTLRLTTTSTGYQLIDDDDNTEVYNSNGQLVSVTTRAGIVQTLSYDTSNRLSTVTDSFGYSLTLTYGSQSRLHNVTDPSSNSVQYAYDSSSRLSTITNLDATTRSYSYTNSTFTNFLTGDTDESGTQFSSWGYNGIGEATSTQESGGAGATTLAYNNNGSVTVTDALGAVRMFSFSIIGNQNRVVSITGSQCPTCDESASTTYDSNGFVASRTDYNGNVTCYSNDSTRGLELVRVEGFASGSTCPSSLSTYTPTSGTRQRKITTTWNSSFREPASITEANRTTTFSYDTSGNLLTKTVTDTTVTPNVSRTWTYTYDSYGHVLTAKGPRTDLSSETTYTYYTCTSGSQCGQVDTITDPVGNVTTFNTYNAYGQPLTITDSNGVVTTLTYDTRQRLTSSQVGSETTSFSYYSTGLLKKVTLPDSSYLLYTYDNAHRLTQISDGAGNSIDYTLDALGNRTAENAYDPSNTLHYTHSRVFNTLSQLYQDVNAAGTSAVTTTFAYDSNGNQTSAAAPLSRTMGSAYDELNRLKQLTDPNSGTTQFVYDAEDDLTSVTDPRSLVTTYGYNGFGEISSQSSPDTGGTTNTYDSGGNLSTSTDARGAVATYAYDALNRPSAVAYSLSGSIDQTVSFTYDRGTNGKGHLTGASDANHSMSWGYDGLGRVTSKSQTVASITKSVGYSYTSGDLTGLTTPSGQTVTYGYNSNHQVTSVTVNSTTVLSSATYEPFGPVNGWTWGNSTSTSRTYDTDQKITAISSAGTKTLSYDNAFRITGISDSESGASNWTYGYDVLDRITSGSDTATTRGWTYDANGDRLTETGTSPSTYTVSSSNNQISSITGTLARTYSYDAAGHTTGYSSISATYNDAGRLKTLTNGTVTETLVYNALGQRIETSGGASGTILYWYDEAGHLLGEYDGSGNLIEETVWLGDTPVATLRTSGSSVAIYYVHTDQLNTPRQVTRPSDNGQMWSWFSDPFGTDAANSNPAGNGAFAYNLRFPGQAFDGQAGLHANYFRDYDPAIGRYVQSDPVGLRGGVNTYLYVGGDPVRGSDSLGLCDNCVPRRAVVAWICQLLSVNDFDARKASVTAYNMRTADNGNNDNPIWREGENWLTAAAWDRWYDPQAYVMNIYLWQYFKYLPGAKEPFSQDALNAGLDGHKHAKASKKDLKKWCQDCER